MENLTEDLQNLMVVSIEPIMQFVDIILMSPKIKIEDFENCIEPYQRKISMLEALPFGATQNNADKLRHELNNLKAIIKLLKSRKSQRDNAGKKSFVDDDRLKELGII